MRMKSFNTTQLDSPTAYSDCSALPFANPDTEDLAKNAFGTTNGMTRNWNCRNKDNMGWLSICCTPCWAWTLISVLIILVLVLLHYPWYLAVYPKDMSDKNLPNIMAVPTYNKASTIRSLAVENNKIIIIGAGAAGLYAGYTLKHLGVENFEILEASDKIGGRIGQLDDFVHQTVNGEVVSLPLDLGAEWIHVDPVILKDLLLLEANNNVYETYDDDTWRRDLSTTRETRNKWNDDCADDDYTDDYPTYNFTTDVVVNQTVLNSLPETFAYHPKTLGDQNGPCCEGEYYDYGEYKFYNTTWWGYFNEFIYPHVASQVRLNTVVKTIDYSSSSIIKITTLDGQVLEANQVIVATPISILKNQDIVFLPALDASKRKAIDKVTFAPGVKLMIEFSEKFYPDWTGFGHAIEYFDGVFGKPTNQYVLSLLELGPRATIDGIPTKTDDEIIQLVLNELDDIFGNGIATKTYLKHHVENWSQKPYIQGTYSYNWDYWWDDIPTLKASIGNKRIYFAGEYLHPVHTATVHGAAMTAQEAVEQLVKDNAL